MLAQTNVFAPKSEDQYFQALARCTKVQQRSFCHPDRDQGPGVVSSELATIFEPFRRGSEGKSGTGAGLGLAISRALIEAHCGKIWVESEVGRGSIFYLSLPLATLPILESTE